MSGPPVAGCGHCGGEVPIPAAGGWVRCGHCGASLWVESRGAVLHYVLVASTGREDVPALIGRWLFDARIPGDAAGPVEVGEKPVHIPFWRIGRGGAVEWFPAAATRVGRIEAPPGIEGELIPFDPRLEEDGAFVSATSPAPATAEGADVWLVHVPVHEVSLSVAGRPVNALVDANGGSVIGSTAIPGSIGAPASAGGAILWGGTIAIVILGIAVPWSWGALAAWAAVAGLVHVLLGRRAR